MKKVIYVYVIRLESGDKITLETPSKVTFDTKDKTISVLDEVIIKRAVSIEFIKTLTEYSGTQQNLFDRGKDNE